MPVSVKQALKYVCVVWQEENMVYMSLHLAKSKLIGLRVILLTIARWCNASLPDVT